MIAWGPEGDFQIFSLRDQTRTLSAKLPPLPPRTSFQVIAREDRILVITGIFPFPENTDAKFLGTIYGLDRQTGNLIWARTNPFPTDLFGQTGSHPVLALIEKKQEQPLRQGPALQKYALVLLDLRTGEQIHRYENQNLTTGILMTADREHHTVQVRHPHSSEPYVVDVTFTDQPKDPVKPEATKENEKAKEVKPSVPPSKPVDAIPPAPEKS
ncbi:MAG: hypothetical protein U0903_06065 [Planctomycetales bacterium]